MCQVDNDWSHNYDFMVEGDSQALPKRKAENNNQGWGYEAQFREYAFLVGRKGKEAFESLDNYPSRIELDSSWHKVLDTLRTETKKDRNERFAVVGYGETSRDLYFPETVIKGEPYRVPRELITDMIHAAKREHGVTTIVGDIHSHYYVGPLTFGDFYSFLNEDWFNQPLIRGLVNPKENIFAFRTRETYMVEAHRDPEYGSSEGFKEYWMKASGFKSSPKANHIARARPTADMWHANIAIAQAHRLALYKGKPQEDLIRAYP